MFARFKKNQKPSIDESEIEYTTHAMLELSDKELEECSALYSSSYGTYTIDDPKHPGQQIKMGIKHYKRDYCIPHIYIARARWKGNLIGHAIYLRKKCEIKERTEQRKHNGIVTWVLQLVVDEECRQQGIASMLLKSIWGFSDDYAWGLASANPCTIRTLERATFRKCKAKIIKANLNNIKQLGKDIAFVEDESYFVTNNSSQINTKFYADNSDFKKDDLIESRLGYLRKGYEWLAFTFQTQEIQKEEYAAFFDRFVEFSEKKLKDAYNRMKIDTHGWAKGTVSEVDTLIPYLGEGELLDFGCGTGRHAIEFAKRGRKVTGVDFADTHIKNAIQIVKEQHLESLCEFQTGDVRIIDLKKTYQNVICLYDVIGSFPNEESNQKIIMNIHRHLEKGGTLAISVMNMELTDRIVPDEQKMSLKNNPRLLLKLPPSDIMQSSGDIFDKKYLLIDTDSGLVYRKEQFEKDNELSAEYVIRDKRYYMKEICTLLEKCGFRIKEKRYVRAGHFSENLNATDPHAKEILVIAEKK